MLSFLTLFSLDICNWTSEKDLGELITVISLERNSLVWLLKRPDKCIMSERGPTVRVDLILFSLNSKYKSRPKNISFIDKC